MQEMSFKYCNFERVQFANSNLTNAKFHNTAVDLEDLKKRRPILMSLFGICVCIGLKMVGYRL